MLRETMSIKSNLVIQQTDTKPLLIDKIDIHHEILKQFTSFKQFGKYASTNKATYELIKDFGFNELRDSLEDGSFYKNTDLIKLVQKRFKRLAPLNREIRLMIDPKAIFSNHNNSIFLNTLAFDHPEIYLSSLKEAISNGFNRETFLEGLTQDDIVMTLNQEDETVFSGKETIVFQNPKEFFENPNNECYLNHLYSFYPSVLSRGLMDALSHPYFNTSAQYDLAIRFASKYGQTEIAQLLLKDSRVDPSAQAIDERFKNSRVDPSAESNYAIRWTSTKGHTETVKLLLADSRVDPSANSNYPIKWASRNGLTETVKLLLQDSRVDPTVRDNYAIIWASKYGHTETVKLLLKHEQVDPSARNNLAIWAASRNVRSDTLKILLEDSRVDTSALYNMAMRMPTENGHTEIVKLLENSIMAKESQ
ncbi:ankyrin repeat-containing domain protein [Globomyces pollinis-pini]|nr:ankyrin repeat-containing domain protein [Globomyces pollinis-pini]